MDPFVYTFIFGGVVFAFGIFLSWRQGSIGFGSSGIRNLLLVSAVFLFYFSLQWFLQYEAPLMDSAKPTDYVSTPKSQAAVDPEQGYRGSTIDYAIMIGYFGIIVILGMFFGQDEVYRGLLFWWSKVCLVVDCL